MSCQVNLTQAKLNRIRVSVYRKISNSTVGMFILKPHQMRMVLQPFHCLQSIRNRTMIIIYEEQASQGLVHYDDVKRVTHIRPNKAIHAVTVLWIFA